MEGWGGEGEGEGGSKMSSPSTSSLSVELLSRVIDVKYGCLTFFIIFRRKSPCAARHNPYSNISW